MDKLMFVEQILKQSGITNNYSATISRIANIIVKALDNNDSVQLTRSSYENGYALNARSKTVDITLVDGEDITSLIEGKHYNRTDGCSFNRFVPYTDTNMFMLPYHDGLSSILCSDAEFQEIVLSKFDTDKYFISCTSFRTGEGVCLVYYFNGDYFTQYYKYNAYSSIVNLLECNCNGSLELIRDLCSNETEVLINSDVSELAMCIEEKSGIYNISSIEPTEVTIDRYGHIFTFLFRSYTTSKIYCVEYHAALDSFEVVKCISNNTILEGILNDIGMGNMYEWQYGRVYDGIYNGSSLYITAYGSAAINSSYFKLEDLVVTCTMSSECLCYGNESIYFNSISKYVSEDEFQELEKIEPTQLVVFMESGVVKLIFLSCLTGKVMRFSIDGVL